MSLARKSERPTPMCRYTLEWRLPHQPCPGERILASADVPQGTGIPEEIMSLWRPGQGYAVCYSSLSIKPIRRWSKEAKGAARRRNLQSRLERKVPLFAAIMAEQEIARRPAYFAGE